MNELRLKQLYYLLLGKLQGADVTRKQIKDLLPEIDYAINVINRLDKENTELRSKYLKQRQELLALRGLRERNEKEINNLKKSLEKVL